MKKTKRHIVLGLMMLMLLVMPGVIRAQQAAGITPDKANRITVPTTLTVQSGSNYIRFEAELLPAVVTYIPSAPFGTIPMAVVMGDTIAAEVVFADCGMTWRWAIEEGESDKIIEIKAHEKATILATPYVCEPTYSDTTAVACDSLLWNGVWYKQSGDYEYLTTNAAGCDSTATLHLTVGHSYNRTLDDVKACDSYVWRGPTDTTIYDSGTYTRRFKSVHGCDSLVTLTVTIGKSYLDAKDVVTAYDSYTWKDGNTYKKSISGPVLELSTIDGCDSTVTLNLTIRHLVTDTFVRTLCATELPYEWFGKKYNESGLYSSDTIEGKAVGGVYMDTVHTVDLTVIPVTTGDTTATACRSFTWYGTTYTQSGAPTHKLMSQYDCDSIVTLHLTINQPSASEETKQVCDSYKWNGVTYTASGDYTFETTNIAGCDSIATLHLTVSYSSTSELIVEKCERYTSPAGHEYTESGTFTETITNKAGCDSTITIYLTILHDCLQPTEYDTVYFCPGFNREHEERVSEALIRRYMPYTYQSPAEWDYMEGVMLQTEHDRTLMDLARAEANLLSHYVGELTPVERIVWSVRYDKSNVYTPIETGDQPQWINAGRLAVQIQFRCGEMYNTAYPMDTEMVNSEETKGRKILRNGQIIIIRNGKEYNLLGEKIQ